MSACGGAAAERGLRDGLTEGDICDAATGFSHVTGITPSSEQTYLEWRSSYVYDATAVENWESTKASILENSSSDAQKNAELAEAFESVVTLVESSGSCAYPECDRYVLPADGAGFGLGYDGGRYHLFASGPNGPTLVSTTSQAEEFLAPIDTPADAAWIAEADGYRVSCDANSYAEDDTGYVLYAETGSTCGGDISGHRLHVSRDGTLEELDSAVVEKGDSGCAIGRLPGGTLASSCEDSRVEHPVGAYFAAAARLEGASVVAFLELARDLAHHGAPSELVSWAERAACEETDHAELCQALAERYGALVPQATIEPSAVRSLLDIARENAVEGLTREAFGAVVAHHQLVTASDPAVRAALRTIARDETRHAEFSIALHRWLWTQLSDDERAEITAVRLAAVRGFRHTLCARRSTELESAAGFPPPSVATRLYDALFAVDFAA